MSDYHVTGEGYACPACGYLRWPNLEHICWTGGLTYQPLTLQGGGNHTAERTVEFSADQQRIADLEARIKEEQDAREKLAAFVSKHTDEINAKREKAEALNAELRQQIESRQFRGHYQYAHMCRDGHPQIGHNESTEPEELACPVCAEKAARALVVEHTNKLGERVMEAWARDKHKAGRKDK